MKRPVCLVIGALLLSPFLESSVVGKAYVRQRPGEAPARVFQVPRGFSDSWTLGQREAGRADTSQTARKGPGAASDDRLELLNAYFRSEEQKGNLRIRLVQDDTQAGMEHRRYIQYYKDLEVFGGEIIRHLKGGQLVGLNGEYYEIGDFDTAPVLDQDTARGLLGAALGRSGLVENAEKSKLIIYPLRDGDYRLAYQLILNGGPGASVTGLVDAKTGEVLLLYPNIRTVDLTIGRGTGFHGETCKFPTTLQNNRYWLMDLGRARPVSQYTYDYRTVSGNFYYVASDADNNWDYDGALVNAHSFLGLIYDYFYLRHGRKGADDQNLDIKATIHWPDPGYADNAFWDPQKLGMYFGEPGSHASQYAAALDVIAHEFTHGITSFTSNLFYFWESGALSEAFSDIMGTAIEFSWQDSGTGFLKADWLVGEDSRPNFSPNGCRNLADPNSNSQRGDPRYPDPCHLNQQYALVYRPNNDGVVGPDDYVDYGWVHINSTIYSHAFYLLANGGTNKISGISVSGVGLEKAAKIFYRAWVHYLNQKSDFQAAANALLQSAFDLYGGSSNENAQTIKAMQAIGWIVK